MLILVLVPPSCAVIAGIEEQQLQSPKSQGFTSVGLSDVVEVASARQLHHGPRLRLPKGVADAAKGVSVEPYDWNPVVLACLVAAEAGASSAAGFSSAAAFSSAAGAGSSSAGASEPATHASKRQKPEPAKQETVHDEDVKLQRMYENAGAPTLRKMLQAHLRGNTVADIRSSIKLTVTTDSQMYGGFADAAVLKHGFTEATFLNEDTAAVVDWKTALAFANRTAVWVQALMQLIATRVPVVFMDMAIGMRVWVLRGNTFHPFHGAEEDLSLAEGIALMQYFDSHGGKLDNADLPDDFLASGSGGGSGASGDASSAPSAAGSGASVPSGTRGNARSGANRADESALDSPESVTAADYEDSGIDDFNDPTVDLKLRLLLVAQALRSRDLDIPDDVLASLNRDDDGVS